MNIEPDLGGSMTVGLTSPTTWCDPGYAVRTEVSVRLSRRQLMPTIGSLRAPGAASGTTGFFGITGSIRR